MDVVAGRMTFVDIEPIEAKERPLGDGLGYRLPGQVSPDGIMAGDRDLPRPQCAKLAERCACDLSETILREFGRFSEADEE